jgi:hypothetical protein
MATLSVKVTTADRDRFEQWCEDQGETVSSVLREFVRMALKSGRYEVCHPEVGPPVGWLYLEQFDDESA